MAKKRKYDREPVNWITINGNRVPVFEDGSLGSFMSGKEQPTGQEGGLTDKEMRDKGYVIDAPIKDDPNYNKKRIEREIADENDAYDKKHGEGKYQKNIDTDKAWEIADRYTTSTPVSGNWDTEPEHFRNALEKELGISRSQAEDLMVNEFGWDRNDIPKSKSLKVGDKEARVADINNDYKSRFGLENVGELKAEKFIGGVAMVGTVEPTKENVQEYFDTGKFDNYGTSARAKKDIAKKIVDDMHGRGYDVTVSEDGTKIYPAGETGKTLSFGMNKDGKWVVKDSTSAGTKGSTGFKKSLEYASKSLKIGDKEVGVSKSNKSVRSLIGDNGDWKISKAYDRTSLKELALDAGVSSSKVNDMSTSELREMLLAMWKKK